MCYGKAVKACSTIDFTISGQRTELSNAQPSRRSGWRNCFATHRASLCSVRAVEEFSSTRRAFMLASFIKTALWVVGITPPQNPNPPLRCRFRTHWRKISDETMCPRQSNGEPINTHVRKSFRSAWASYGHGRISHVDIKLSIAPHPAGPKVSV